MSRIEQILHLSAEYGYLIVLFGVMVESAGMSVLTVWADGEAARLPSAMGASCA